MSIGSVLVGVAAALVVAAFVAQPLRQARVGDVERQIERWVAQARAEAESERPGGRRQEAGGGRQEATEPAAFCPQCGRRVGPEDRFCARCGKPLREE